MAGTGPLDHELLRAAQRLAPEIAGLPAQIETSRWVPAALAEAIAAAGLSHMYMPKSVGGP